MLLSLFLDFSAGTARELGGIVWKAAVVLWLPQLLALWLVLRRRDARALNRSAEVARLLIPFFLFAGTLCAVPAIGLLLLMYADVDWGLWLLVLWLPTLIGIFIVVATNTVARERPATAAKPAWPRGLYWLSGLLALLLVGAGALLRFPAGTTADGSHAPLDSEQLREWQRANRAELRTRAREDSLRFLEQWEKKKPTTQPW